MFKTVAGNIAGTLNICLVLTYKNLVISSPRERTCWSDAKKKQKKKQKKKLRARSPVKEIQFRDCKCQTAPTSQVRKTNSRRRDKMYWNCRRNSGEERKESCTEDDLCLVRRVYIGVLLPLSWSVFTLICFTPHWYVYSCGYVFVLELEWFWVSLTVFSFFLCGVCVWSFVVLNLLVVLPLFFVYVYTCLCIYVCVWMCFQLFSFVWGHVCHKV